MNIRSHMFRGELKVMRVVGPRWTTQTKQGRHAVTGLPSLHLALYHVAQCWN
jgi:hypothetical protein